MTRSSTRGSSSRRQVPRVRERRALGLSPEPGRRAEVPGLHLRHPGLRLDRWPAYDFRYVLASAGVHARSCPCARGSPRPTGPQRQRRARGDDVHAPAGGSQEPWRIGVHRLDYEARRSDSCWRRPSGLLIGPDGMANKDAVHVQPRRWTHRDVPSDPPEHPGGDVRLAGAPLRRRRRLLGAHLAEWNTTRSSRRRRAPSQSAPARRRPHAGGLHPLLPRTAGRRRLHRERCVAGRGDRAHDLAPDRTRTRTRAPWEREGDVDNVVFVQGAHRRDDGTIYLTYGAADRAVGAAVVSERHLLAALAASR